MPSENRRFLRACRGLSVDAAPVWFALTDERPLAFFAGIWMPQWNSVRKVKEGEGSSLPRGTRWLDSSRALQLTYDNLSGRGSPVANEAYARFFAGAREVVGVASLRNLPITIIPGDTAMSFMSANFNGMSGFDILAHVFDGKMTREVAQHLQVSANGYGEFINQVSCRRKFAMDLNPKTARCLDPSVTFCQQDCSARWQLEDNSLNLVFTSNFFEHLPDKIALGKTLDETKRCLAPGGRLIAMGPNIKYLPATYWEFWDHHLPLTENAMGEALETRGFQIEAKIAKFLPYTMVNRPQYPIAFLRLYLKLRMAWPLFGRQFLVIARKT